MYILKNGNLVRPVMMVALGDSYTHNTDLGVKTSDFWPSLIVPKLEAVGIYARCRNLGISGDSTRVAGARTGMRNRIAQVLKYEVPTLVVLYGGTNDGNAYADFGTPGPYGSATLAYEGETRPNLEYMADYLLDAGVEYVIICGQHFLNFTGAGGDTIDSYPGATTCHGKQKEAATNAAAAAPGHVAFCDLWQYFNDHLKANPTKIDDDTYYHVSAANTHLNAVGEGLIADALVATIQAQTGWLTALS